MLMFFLTFQYEVLLFYPQHLNVEPLSYSEPVLTAIMVNTAKPSTSHSIHEVKFIYLMINPLRYNFTIWWHRSGSTMGPSYSLLLVRTNPWPKPVVTSHRCVLWHSQDSNFPWNTHGINLLDEFENYIVQTAADSQAPVCIIVFVVLFTASPIIKAS